MPQCKLQIQKSQWEKSQPEEMFQLNQREQIHPSSAPSPGPQETGYCEGQLTVLSPLRQILGSSGNTDMPRTDVYLKAWASHGPVKMTHTVHGLHHTV